MLWWIGGITRGFSSTTFPASIVNENVSTATSLQPTMYQLGLFCLERSAPTCYSWVWLARPARRLLRRSETRLTKRFSCSLKRSLENNHSLKEARGRGYRMLCAVQVHALRRARKWVKLAKLFKKVLMSHWCWNVISSAEPERGRFLLAYISGNFWPGYILQPEVRV